MAALEAVDYCCVFETGRILFHGPERQLLSDNRVRKACIGEGH